MTVWERFLIGFSGADIETLKSSQCKTEIPKYASLGLMVLCTGTLGMISGGYALFTIFGDVLTSAFFGGLWGIFVGGIDRYFVITARKQEPEYPYKKQDNWQQIKMAIPRLIFASFIGLIVSKPLELRIFKTEIEAQLSKEKIEKIQQIEKNIIEYEEINKLEQQITLLRQQEEQLRKQWSKAEQIAHEEAEGRSGTEKIGKGPVYQEKREQADELLNQLKDKRKQIDNNQEKIDKYRYKLDNKLAIVNQKQEQASTLLARLEALDNLAEEKPIVGHINLCITFLFIMVEIMPLSLKLMTKYGAYDKAIDTKEKDSMFQLEQERKFEENRIKDKIKNQENIQQKINEFNSRVIKEAMTKTINSPKLEVIFDNISEQIVNNTEEEILKQINNLPNNTGEIIDEIKNTQQYYTKKSVPENLKQKKTRSITDDLFHQCLDELKQYNGNFNHNGL